MANIKRVAVTNPISTKLEDRDVTATISLVSAFRVSISTDAAVVGGGTEKKRISSLDKGKWSIGKWALDKWVLVYLKMVLGETGRGKMVFGKMDPSKWYLSKQMGPGHGKKALGKWDLGK